MGRILQIVFGVIWLASAGRGSAEEGEIARWIGGLNSSDFAERVRSEKALRAAGREALAALRVAVKSEDPQTRFSAGRILDSIMSDPANIPTLYRSLDLEGDGDYGELTEKWMETAVVGSKNVDGRAGTSGNFAQSFVPECGTIAAIEVCTYPLTGGHGWLRLDVCKDEGGRPSKTVLGRSWVYAPKGHKFPHGGYIVHRFEEIPVGATDRLWMVYVGFKDADCTQNLINYGLSFRKDDYPAGMLWRESYPTPRGDEDVKFRVFEKADPHPKYREATDGDKKSFPDAASANALWENLVRSR